MSTKKPAPKTNPITSLLFLFIIIGFGIYIYSTTQTTPPPAQGTAMPLTSTNTPRPINPTRTPELTEETAITNMLPGVRSVFNVQRDSADYFAQVNTLPRFDKQSFAQQIFVAASSFNPLITRFAVQINDGTTISWHSFDATTGTWAQNPEPPAWVNLP